MKRKGLTKVILTPYSWVNLSLVLMLLGLIQIWVLTFYYQTAMNEWISWIANDGNIGTPFAFGQHYFGDYLTMHDVSKSRDLSAFDNSYPPLGVIPFWLISGFPYRIGLLIWFIVIVASLLSPLLATFPRMDKERSVGAIIALGAVTIPTISVLDRGNSVGLLTGLFFIFYYFGKQNKDWQAGLALGVAIGMKIYPLVMIPFLIVKGKYKQAIVALSSSIFLNLIALLVWSKGNYLESISYIIARIREVEQTFPSGHGMYVSSSQIVINVLNKLGLADTTLGSFVIANYQVVSLFTLAALLFLAWYAKGNYWYLYMLCSIQLIPSLSFSYYRVWTPVAIAIIFWERGLKNKSQLSKFENIWLLVCVLNTSILVLFNFWPINVLATLAAFLIFLTYIDLRRARDILKTEKKQNPNLAVQKK
jgi:hypothetical protein